MALNHVYLLIVYFVGCECYSKSDMYIKQPTFADQMFPADQVKFQTVTRNAISCGQHCSAIPGCTGFVYLQLNKTCFGIHSQYPLSAMSLPLTGAVLYIPIIGGMQLWFVTLPLTYEEAQTTCAGVGSLVKLDTADKLSAVKTYLLDPNNGSLVKLDTANNLSAVKTYLLDANNGYNQSFWVQGRYDVTDDAWEYANGTPLLAGQWHPGTPNSVGAECVMLWNDAGFAFDDYWCYYHVGFICEYQN